ncbi:MAG: efflux RND transporter permease subunit [Candidatus Saccharibacteria bacterium]
MFKKSKSSYTDKQEARLLPRLSLYFFDRPKITAVIWLSIFVFGVLSYTSLLNREGFPTIEIPYTVAGGSYLVNDSAKVDNDITKPLGEIALRQPNIKSVSAQAFPNQFTLAINYKDGTDAAKATKDFEEAVNKSKVLPAQAKVAINTPKFGFTSRGDDFVVSFYSDNSAISTKDLTAQAENALVFLKTQDLSLFRDVSLINPYTKGLNPETGQEVVKQSSFDWYGTRQENKNTFYNSVNIGLTKNSGADIIKANSQLNQAIDQLNKQPEFASYTATISASYANSINDQISELQKALIEGLIAILIIGSIVIAIRASFITVISMVSVLSITLGILFLIGYSLNTITLFTLILALALIVDDTIIMVEAIDAQRRRQKDARLAVKTATQKVSRAMIAATSTAALSFAPLLFVGGILGGFIRAIPVTIITSLIVSLVVALVFIPLFSRLLLLRKKQMGKLAKKEFSAGFEAKFAEFIASPMLWARNSTKKMVFVGLVAVFIGLGFIFAGALLFQKVTFNIFPPTKDTNDLVVSQTYLPGLSIEQAASTASEANKIVGTTLAQNFEQSSYNSSGTSRDSTMQIHLLSYKDREIKSPQLIKDLQKAFVGFKNAQVKVSQQDVGPPASDFTVRIETDNRQAAYVLARDMEGYLKTLELTRMSGEVARVTATSVGNPASYNRADGVQYVDVKAELDGSDTTTLFGLAQKAIKKQYTNDKLANFGLKQENIKFDIGFESDNQDSFKSLVVAFPILLVVIFIVLAVEFKSLMQPLLIFMAIPFSLFGITLGLYLTKNPFSFFAMLGFFALIGLSIKNTILLTDFANQSRRAGMSAVDSAVAALEERFRPLVATSLTAIVAMIPLALSSPFWEGLAIVLIGGLVSSTFLVLTVFPYYYLGAEFLRVKSSKFFKRLRKI